MSVELYYRETCPYSTKVRKFIHARGLDEKIALHEIELDDDSHFKLMRINYGAQVPCLLVDGKPLLESEAIIAWIEAHEKTLSQNPASP